MKRYNIKFKYRDEYSNGKWSEQECTIYADSKYAAEKECRKIYGLGIDCEYIIYEVTEIV